VKSAILIFALLLLTLIAKSQFPSAAGKPGSTAIHADSNIFINWASYCTVSRGWQDVSNQNLGFTTVGDSSFALGKAGVNGVVSLGDGGSATLTFNYPIVNGNGWDFAVFENSFSDYFLELAFVEVSSDGINFFRFPSTSLTQTDVQVGTFDTLNPEKINNLAGKYRALYGTPFDLQELDNMPGLNVNNITHVKIIDVVGSLQSAFASYDKNGNKINDPWNTPFPSGGFDLDAVGVIHNVTTKVQEKLPIISFQVFPNPASQFVTVRLNNLNENLLEEVDLMDIFGKKINISSEKIHMNEIYLDVSSLNNGLYYLQFKFADKINLKTKIIVCHD
jgi:hypothetical protein